ncbi:alpha/beta hydrolase [Nocardia sp. NPDC051570]|uniref:alpha/beta hydrolase n=1 Tax=Nocardia sp. NPDC051570 TaxID=3364324 RepID=UPI00379A65AE
MPVSLTAASATEYEVYGRLCRPPDGGGRAVQLLVAGITYDHNYWDLPDSVGHERYSYIDAATDAGMATFALDRIGIGRSSHPPGAAVTLDSNSYVVHEVVQALRHGIAGAPGYSKVALVGHSYGSWTSWHEAGAYHDVDAVVFSGAAHGLNPLSPLAVLPNLYPAQWDPELSGTVPDLGYLTSRPGLRQLMFHAPGRVDPTLLDYDEQHKQTVTVGEIDNFPQILLEPVDIRVPVLLADGSDDPLFCGGPIAPNCSDSASLSAYERRFLGADVPSVDAYVLPGAGHDLNYAPNAHHWFAIAQRWITNHLR